MNPSVVVPPAAQQFVSVIHGRLVEHADTLRLIGLIGAARHNKFEGWFKWVAATALAASASPGAVAVEPGANLGRRLFDLRFEGPPQVLAELKTATTRSNPKSIARSLQKDSVKQYAAEYVRAATGKPTQLHLSLCLVVAHTAGATLPLRIDGLREPFLLDITVQGVAQPAARLLWWVNRFDSALPGQGV